MHKTVYRELIYNYGSIIIMALGGILFSIIIAALYNAETVGLFNRSYSYYLVLSQISVCGIHMAVLKIVSDYRDNKTEGQNILKSALCIVIIISLIVIIVSETLLWRTSIMTRQRRQAIMYIIPALFFFSLNKIFLNYINACSEMIAFAVFQALRNIFICGGIILLAFLKVAGVALTSVFFWEEGILFLVMLFYLIRKKELCGKMSLKNGRRLIGFGIKIMPSNIVLEITTKVDLICLGWFISNEAIIGVYSFVSLISEGFYQVYMVIRRMINPKLSLWVQKKDIWEEKYKFIKKICMITAGPLVFLIWLMFYIMIIILNKPIYGQGMIPLIIVASSIALNGLFIIYGNSMSLLGYPGKESIINIITVTSNFVFNIIFIAQWGIVGAAVATAISYCCFSAFVYVFIKKGIKKCKLSYI